VAALGRRGERRLGLRIVPLESIVGSVDRARDFDRWFRPRSGRSRERWERLARAQRRGEAIPPIDVYRVGELHFVRDGHHRVSVAHALGLRAIEAYVTEVTTRIDATGISRRGDLITKDLRRVFLDRVPLPGPALATILVTTAWSYAELSEEVEAWGFRLMQQEARFLDRETVARRWYAEEYRPVVRMLAQADLIGERTEAEAYLDLAAQRYRLMRTHRWDDEVIDRLRSDPGRR
jgi:ParB-like chromosome segregation protein Spo0J